MKGKAGGAGKVGKGKGWWEGQGKEGQKAMRVYEVCVLKAGEGLGKGEGGVRQGKGRAAWGRPHSAKGRGSNN